MSSNGIPTWRDQLIRYIKSKGGYYQDRKWQLEYFEEFNEIGHENKKTTHKI
jgi:hypothetical protein